MKTRYCKEDITLDGLPSRRRPISDCKRLPGNGANTKDQFWRTRKQQCCNLCGLLQFHKSLKCSMCAKSLETVEDNAFLVHGAQVWDSMHGSARKRRGGHSKPSFCVAFQHGSSIFRIFPRVTQPGCGYGRPLPRRVCACDAQCCREKRPVHCGPRLIIALCGVHL